MGFEEPLNGGAADRGAGDLRVCLEVFFGPSQRPGIASRHGRYLAVKGDGFQDDVFREKRRTAASLPIPQIAPGFDACDPSADGGGIAVDEPGHGAKGDLVPMEGGDLTPLFNEVVGDGVHGARGAWVPAGQAKVIDQGRDHGVEFFLASRPGPAASR